MKRVVAGKGTFQDALLYEHQADAVLSQANPVSGTYYTVLDTTANVRLLSLAAAVTWAVTQPTPLVIRVIIDGQTHLNSRTDPVTATYYRADVNPRLADADQTLQSSAFRSRSFFLEGRSVKVEVAITWATTQPTPLVCRVKYAKIP